MMIDHKTMLPRKPTATAEAFDEPSPFLVEFFMVQGAGYRCMAYHDQDGKWRMAFNNEELRGNIRVLE